MTKEEHAVFQRLLCRINKVTAPHRHGRRVPAQDLTALANYQIEAEEWLKIAAQAANSTGEAPQPTNGSTPLVCIQCKQPIKDGERVVHQSCFNPISI